MHEIPSEIRTLKRSTCPRCSTRYYAKDPPEFCEKCGQNLTYRTEVQMCPFCGDDLDDRHLAYGEHAQFRIAQVRFADDAAILMADNLTWRVRYLDQYDEQIAYLTPIDYKRAASIINNEIVAAQAFLDSLHAALHLVGVSGPAKADEDPAITYARSVIEEIERLRQNQKRSKTDED